MTDHSDNHVPDSSVCCELSKGKEVCSRPLILRPRNVPRSAFCGTAVNITFSFHPFPSALSLSEGIRRESSTYDLWTRAGQQMQCYSSFWIQDHSVNWDQLILSLNSEKCMCKLFLTRILEIHQICNASLDRALTNRSSVVMVQVCSNQAVSLLVQSDFPNSLNSSALLVCSLFQPVINFYYMKIYSGCGCCQLNKNRK